MFSPSIRILNDSPIDSNSDELKPIKKEIKNFKQAIKDAFDVYTSKGLSKGRAIKKIKSSLILKDSCNIDHNEILETAYDQKVGYDCALLALQLVKSNNFDKNRKEAVELLTEQVNNDLKKFIEKLENTEKDSPLEYSKVKKIFDLINANDTDKEYLEYCINTLKKNRKKRKVKDISDVATKKIKID